MLHEFLPLRVQRMTRYSSGEPSARPMRCSTLRKWASTRPHRSPCAVESVFQKSPFSDPPIQACLAHEGCVDTFFDLYVLPVLSSAIARMCRQTVEYPAKLP